MTDYKFTLALENSLLPHYMTEKIWEPLAAGSVPVYFGAPNARELLGLDSAVIFADEFANVEVTALSVQGKHFLCGTIFGHEAGCRCFAGTGCVPAVFVCQR